jgi:hypothetical protein
MASYTLFGRLGVPTLYAALGPLLARALLLEATSGHRKHAH